MLWDVNTTPVRACMPLPFPRFSFSLFRVCDVLCSHRFFSLACFRSALPSLLHWATLLYFIVMQRGHFYYDRANISRFQLAANAFIAESVFASSPFPLAPQNTILYLLQSGHVAGKERACNGSNKNKSMRKSKWVTFKSILIDIIQINLNNKRFHPT